MLRYVMPALIVLSMLVVAARADDPAPRVSVEQFENMVVIYVHDLDLLRDGHADLWALARIGQDTRMNRIDLSAQYQTPGIMISKARMEPVDSVNVRIMAGREQLFAADIPAGPVLKAEPRVPLTEQKAYITTGVAVNAPPVADIIQPDISAIEAVKLPEAERRLNFEEIAYKVISDINFPLVSAANNCAISRQTAHPDDPSRRSIYVPLKSQLYNPETGAAGPVMHYLAEAPLNPAWLDGPETIHLGPDDIKIHATTARWPDNERGQFIAGVGAGGLGQLVGAMTVDDDGNIYFSNTMASQLVRFNVAKAEWEAPPINLVEYMNRFLPAAEEMPEELRGRGARFDNGYVISTGGGRIFFGPRRYANYGMVYCNGVFSFPLEHWYDAQKFEEGSRFLAGSWPTAKFPLYDTWPQQGAAARTIHSGFLSGDSYYLPNYGSSVGGPWRIDLNPDGSAREITVINGGEYARALQQAQRPPYPQAASGLINWWDYGALSTSRAQLARALGMNVQGDAPLAVYYDAINAMQQDPQRYELLLNNIAGPSLAPCYMAAEIPDMPGSILGVGEYGYYLAYLDVAGAADGTVVKKYLKLGNENVQTDLPVKVGLGPYGYLWWKDGGNSHLVMPGYIGIARMLFSVDGAPLEHHDARSISIRPRSLDGAPTGGIHRYQYPLHGVDGKVFLTGSHTADRGGSAYSGGLMAFDAVDGSELLRLTQMSRGSSTSLLRTRIIHDAMGRKHQQFAMAAGRPVTAYLLQMQEEERPENQDAKLFIYDFVEGTQPRDIFGFSLVSINDSSGMGCQIFSRNGRYLLTYQHRTLLTIDMETFQYVDGLKITGAINRFYCPSYRFISAPDGRIFFAAAEDNGNVMTFYEVNVNGLGHIAVEPRLTIDAPDAGRLQMWDNGVKAFVADPAGDGSYDLAIGPSSRVSGVTMWIIRDFIPARR